MHPLLSDFVDMAFSFGKVACHLMNGDDAIDKEGWLLPTNGGLGDAGKGVRGDGIHLGCTFLHLLDDSESS